MSKFGLKNIWNIKAGGGSVNTSNLAKTNEANTFTGKNTFKDTGDILTIQTTNNNSGGVDFKQQDNTRIGYIGGSERTPNKMTLWGKNGLILQANGQNVEVNSGAGLLKYTTTNTTKDRQEVMVRNDFCYVRKYTGSGFTINANGYQAAEFTVNGLTTGLNEFYIVMTTSTVDVGYDIKIQCNNLNYPNLSDVKTVVVSNITQNIDFGGMIQIVWMVYGNNKLRFRAKNTINTNITFNGLRVYHRIPAKLVDN